MLNQTSSKNTQYPDYIKEIKTLRGFITNAGENCNQVNKTNNFSTRDECYSLLINFIMWFKPFKKNSETFTLSDYTMVDSSNFKEIESEIGVPKCKAFKHAMIYGLKKEHVYVWMMGTI